MVMVVADTSLTTRGHHQTGCSSVVGCKTVADLDAVEIVASFADLVGGVSVFQLLPV